MIKVDSSELGRLQVVFEGLEFLSGDLRDVLESVAEAISKAFADIFDREGPGWQHLSPVTIAFRRWRISRGEITVGPSRPILEQEGRLKRSFVDVSSPDNVLDIQPRMLTYGSLVPYAITHEGGLDGIPQRKILNESILRPAIVNSFILAYSEAVRAVLDGRRPK